MQFRNLLTLKGLLGALALLSVVSAQAQTSNALSGQVSSAEEGLMEGVLVNAKKDGSNKTTTVVSNDKGQFSFPADRIEPGKYTITIRAAGYDLVGPKTIDLAAGAGAKMEVKLAKSRGIPQLSNAEWLISVPGEEKFKLAWMSDCINCHTLQRVFTSPHTPDEWEGVFKRMGLYAPMTVPARPQMIVSGGNRSERMRVPEPLIKQAAEYLVDVSVHNPDRSYEFKYLPRPKGRATKVIVTEWDLPRKEALVHDVVLDPEGNAWYCDFGAQIVGELNPKTGEVKDYQLPIYRPEQPKGSLDIEIDPDGNMWVGMSYQAGAAKINTKTKEITPYPLNKEWVGVTSQTNHITPTHMNVDGKVWMKDSETRNHYRLDIHTEKWENMGNPQTPDGKNINGYGIPSDKDNNVYMLEYGNTRIGRQDKNTKVAKAWATPSPRSRPRRGRFDDQGLLWFGEYGANAIGMFDPTTEKIKEWLMPTPWSQPYDAAPTKGGVEVWTGSMLTDKVGRLITTTDEIVEYMLPRSTNIRRVFVEETTGRPVLWVGSNHGASIIKVEPLD
jgi:virginiamycin B lyase